ncbi:hypothetical protein LPC10_18340 [Methylorubrum sp. B1-46]|uniref:hypothetical protein n=1 Tax=Methylorubrum sp. B1-46 TaxID=2897334 RepID=UPI001E5134D7|nr:hypothetical protein [Methylorubrum sp. B1-46]UGB24874.1 hypothetical protein LPC10_18340 [Methylorubrum sp. B1-46]
MNLTRTAAALLMLASSTCGCYAADHVQIGVIRWDAWFPDSPWATHIHDKRWVGRVPFYGAHVVDGTKKIDASAVDTTEAELAYAAAAGVDYFAFGLYAKDSNDGRPNNIMAQFSRPLDNFVALKNKHGMRFSLVMAGAKSYTENESIRRQFATYVRQGSFARTSDGRPVVFLLMLESSNAIRDPAGERNIIATRDAVTQDAARLVGKQPFLVALAFDANDGAHLVKDLKFDSFGSYGNPLGNVEATSDGYRPFTHCVNSTKYYWSVANKTGVPYIPPVSLGWDYRPVIDDKGRNKHPEWCAQPQGNDVAPLITAALGNARVPTFRSILIYAWNEFLEGGFLAPTLCGGASKLAGLAAATGRERNLATELAARPIPPPPSSCTASAQP